MPLIFWTLFHSLFHDRPIIHLRYVCMCLNFILIIQNFLLPHIAILIYFVLFLFVIALHITVPYMAGTGHQDPASLDSRLTDNQYHCHKFHIHLRCRGASWHHRSTDETCGLGRTAQTLHETFLFCFFAWCSADLYQLSQMRLESSV